MHERSYSFTGTSQEIVEQLRVAGGSAEKTRGVLRQVGCLGSLLSLGACALMMAKMNSSGEVPPAWLLILAVVGAGIFLTMALSAHQEPYTMKQDVARQALRADTGVGHGVMELELDLRRANSTPRLETWVDENHNRIASHRQEWLTWKTSIISLRIERHMKHETPWQKGGSGRRNRTRTEAEWFDRVTLETQQNQDWAKFVPPNGMSLDQEATSGRVLVVRTRRCTHGNQLDPSSFSEFLQAVHRMKNA